MIKRDNLSIIKKRHKPLCITRKGILTYHFGNLYLLNTDTNNLKKISSIPVSQIKKVLGRIRLVERIFRLEPRMAIELIEDDVLFSYQGKMYNLNISSGKIVKEIDFERNMNNPLSIVKICGIKGFNDCIVYGEYIGNSGKGPVAVYARSLNKNDWHKVFEFKANTVMHIHNIIPDEYRNCLYILTGDSDAESGIWVVKDNFSYVKPLLSGLQKFRSCCAFSIPEGVIYATDTPTEQNYIYLMREINDRWELKVLFELNGSCIYATKIGNRFFFSTTVEPDSNLSQLRYRLTYHLGAGIKNRYSELLVGNLQNEFQCVVRLKKDIFPMWLCQFGNIVFCKDWEDKIYAYPVAVMKYDGKLVRIDIHKNNEEMV